jgi:hypothetical protein
MTDKKSFSDSCALLIALLDDHRRNVRGLDKLSMDEKLYGVASSACEVLLHTLSIMTGADYNDAVEGLRSLQQERRLRQICLVMEMQLKDKGLR